MKRGATSRAAPLLVGLASGDITAARASLIVVSHVNGLAPGGAEAAVDDALGGALSRRASGGMLDSHFGASHFIPAQAARLPAGSVLVVGLGEAGKLESERLPEIGWSIVDAMVAVGARDAVTVVHGSGGPGVAPGRAARLLGEGLMAAVAHLPGADEVREVTLVDVDDERIDAVRRGLGRARRPRGLEVIVERGTRRLPSLRRSGPPTGEREQPPHLRLGVTRAGEGLKVTVISDAAYDVADSGGYPRDAALEILRRVEAEVLRADSAAASGRALRELGRRLFDAFLGWTEFDVAETVAGARGTDVVLRLDESTVDLPWELLPLGRGFLFRQRVLARQREITAPGHAAAYVPAHERLRVLVVGDPTGNLPGARSEGEAVAERLAGRGAEVRRLGEGARREDLLRAVDELDPDVLHYAGHARFDELRQQVGGLVLADAVVTADDFASRPHLPRLFFANACNSGQTGDSADQSLFDGAGPTHDFAGGLLRAGVRAFVGSQWRVDDQAALTFARDFYDSVSSSASDGGSASIGDAVRDARRAVVREHGAGEPAWAGYVLYGTPWARAL